MSPYRWSASRSHSAKIKFLIDVNFDVNAGETHALLGENGAGKSTLMKVLIGVYMADSGRIVLDGDDVTTLSLRERLDRGIAMIFQELSVLPNRSVAENLFVLREPRAFGWRVDTQRMIAEAQSLIDRYGFGLRASARVGDLGFAQRQMVEILKALSRGAKLLVMDEPTSSLTVREEETLFATVDQLKASGIGIVYISHRMADVLRLSDRISIVKDGRLIGPLMPSETSIAHIASLMSRSPESQSKSTPVKKLQCNHAPLLAQARRLFPCLGSGPRASFRTSLLTSRLARSLASLAWSAADAPLWRKRFSASFRTQQAQSQLLAGQCKPATFRARSRPRSALCLRTGDLKAWSPAGRWPRTLR